MTTPECLIAIESFTNSIKNDFQVIPTDEGCKLVAPFRYPDFASIELSIINVNGVYKISDDGETFNNLFINGLNIDNKLIVEQISRLAKTYSIEFKDTNLLVLTDINSIGSAIKNILEAIISISFLIYRRRNVERTTFDDEVEKFLISNEIDYSPYFSIHGKANTHTIRYFINSSKNALIETLSTNTERASLRKAKEVAYKWLDIKQIFSNYQFISIVDDRDNKWEKYWIGEEARNAIFQYSTRVYKWKADKEDLQAFVKN